MEEEEEDEEEEEADGCCMWRERDRGRERKGVLIRKVRRHSKKKREEKRSAVDSHFSIIFSLSLSSLRACCCVSTAEEAFARLCVRVSSL